MREEDTSSRSDTMAIGFKEKKKKKRSQNPTSHFTQKLTQSESMI